ncbi:Pycsar system effector family protein [Halalkaliarchaeum desulfuricum]|uniref:Pycsar system effector family protein n=1 Tax=Halalkaliarchaeum desulfuricum TaxID=2055893 RepID=UPI000E6C8347|nr:Pycsar system effector family protein [Halalkaliarchaeum desulfuricum]
MPSPPTDFSAQTLSHLNEYIKFADQKASVLLTGQLAFLGLFVTVLDGNWAGADVEFKILAAMTIGATLLAGVFAGWVIYPQTEPSGGALLFWENINAKCLDDYESEIKGLDEDAMLGELIEENYLLAEVASNKYWRLKVSLVSTAGIVFFATLSMVSLF